MPTLELLKAWQLAFPGGGTSSGEAIFRGKMSSSGAVSPEMLKAFEEVGPDGLRHSGPISKREVSQFYQTLDALILLLPSGKYVTGGKTSEYLATGLPIVSVHDSRSAATELLRDYPLWFPAKDLTPEGIAEALRNCARALQDPDEKRWEAAWAYGQQFLRSTILKPVIAELRGIAGSGTASPQPALEALEERTQA